MHSVDKSRLRGKYYRRLYLAHALIRHYLTTGRKYALIKKYAFNKHVRLLIGLYGMLRATKLNNQRFRYIAENKYRIA